MPLLLVVREGLWGLSTVRKPGSAGHGGRPPNARRRDPTQGWGAPAAVAGLPYPWTGLRAAKLRPVTASVLIVDDDPAFRRLAARMLEQAGIAVAAEAPDAGAALAIARAMRPGGILVDVGLPDRSGVDLARDLLALPWRPRVLLTSADADAAGAGGGSLRFVAKEDLPDAPLHALLVPVTVAM
jgi:CheY-like chemotaxis protein